MSNTEDIGNTENTNTWIKEHEDQLKILKDKAKCYRLLHESNNLSIYEFIFDIENIDIFCNCINTIIFIILGIINCENQTILILIAAIINLINIIITSLIKVNNCSGISKEDRLHSIWWDKFARNIQIELNKSANDKTNSLNFLSECHNEYEKLTQTSPQIKNSTIKNVKKFLKNSTENSLNNTESDNIPIEYTEGEEYLKFIELKKKIDIELCGTHERDITPYKTFIENLNTTV
jgi:hypothetical protein